MTPTNNISQITQDEINQLKGYGGEVEDFYKGVECHYKRNLYAPEDLEKIVGQEKYEYYRKAQILIGWAKFTPIRSIIGRIWPIELSIIEKVRDEIETDTKDLNWMQIYEGRLRPNFAASQGFLKLIKRLDYIINTLATQHAQKPAATEQNTIWTKIKACFWKLYEKTVKAFFDSVLGKWGG